MSKSIVLAFSIVLLLLVYPLNGSSQANLDELKVSISMAKTAFVPHQKLKVQVKVDNQTGQTIKTGTMSVSFELIKSIKKSSDCYLTDCFGASTYWAKKFNNNKTYEFETDLTDLSWKDSILSGMDLNRPKNFYKVVPSGDYYLVLTFQFRDPNSTKEDPRTISVNSNSILVKIEGEKGQSSR